MTVCHPSPSEVSGQFMGTIGITGDSGSGITISGFSTFLFRTFCTDVQVTSGNLDLLRR